MEYVDKIVDFNFCKVCKNCDVNEVEDPCNECLDNPSNLNSQRPIHFEVDEKRLKDEPVLKEMLEKKSE